LIHVSVIIANRQRTKKINLRLLKQLTNALLAELKIENAELGINLVGAKEMAELNWKFLRHEGSTDVITFDYGSSVGRDSRRAAKGKTRLARTLAPPSLHGELFICIDDADVQAKKFKTSWQSEIVRYVVHGILHLIGHDDLKPDLRRKMKREENRLLHGISKKFSLAQIGGGSKLRA
jgi:probable rRNA maturation factor